MVKKEDCQSWRRELARYGLLIAVVVTLYGRTVWFDFVDIDDGYYVSNNPALKSGKLLPGLIHAVTAFADIGFWIPLTRISLLVDALLFRLNPGGFHLTNFVLHAANSCLLYRVLSLTTRTSGRSLLVALLFAVHPMHVESVAWITERKDVLSTFWLLVTLLAYERYARRSSWGNLAIVNVSLALGLMSKPMLVTMPVLLLLFDFWPLQRIVFGGREGRAAPEPRSSNADDPPCAAATEQLNYPQASLWQLLLEKLPLLALCLAGGLVAIVTQRSVGAMHDAETLPLGIRFCFAILGYGFYLSKTLLPIELFAFYPLPLPDQLRQGALLGLIVFWAAVMVVLTGMVLWYRRSRFLVVGWLWFVISLLPVIGLLQVGAQAYADRFVYVPHIGLFIGIVWGVHQVLASWKCPRWLECGIAVAVLLPCWLLSSQQVLAWRNAESLWQHALACDPECVEAKLGLARVWRAQSKLDEALDVNLEVLAKPPPRFEAVLQVGLIYESKGDWEQAVGYLEWARRLANTVAKSDFISHHLEDCRRQLQSSKSSNTKTVTPAPSDSTARLVREGLKAARAGDFRVAAQRFEQAINDDPDYAPAHNNLGMVLQRQGESSRAKKAFAEAIRLNPNQADYHVNLSDMMLNEHDLRGAIQELETAIKLNPADPEVRHKLEKTRADAKRKSAH